VTVWLPPAVETEEDIVGGGDGSLDINHILKD
jgi:hypothetical protein